MKIAVPYENGMVFQHFGHTAEFKFYEVENGQVTASEVVHAMKQNTIVNIATDSPERMERYRCFYRNDVYLYRREGLKGWLWLISKDLWHTAQVCMRAKAHRMEKIGIIWKGFFAGIRFNPQIVYPQAEKDAKGVSL